LHFTKKQWDLEPKELSPLVCGRIPVRTNDDCRYFTDKYQFMPKDGYTKMFERMLNHKNIELSLNTDYKNIVNSVRFNKMIYTGPIDYFFDYKFGKLPYRSIRFEFKNIRQEFYQDISQVNYVEKSVDYTRVVEHKLLNQQTSATTTISFEYPQQEGEPFYPVPTNDNRSRYLLYKKDSDKVKSVYFCGRLAEYQYFNMDQVTASALKLFLEISNE
jgi:UDP-galactopyranose mutase